MTCFCSRNVPVAFEPSFEQVLLIIEKRPRGVNDSRVGAGRIPRRLHCWLLSGPLRVQGAWFGFQPLRLRRVACYLISTDAREEPGRG